MNYSKNTKKQRIRKTIAFLTLIFMLGALLGFTMAKVVDADDKSEPIIEVIAKADEPILKSLGVFKFTAYCPCRKCCGKWANGITATGTKATEGRTIAVDPKKIPLGSKVIIDGHEYIAEDVGGSIKGNKIDMYFNSHRQALDFGVQYKEVFVYE